nr:adenylate/guanylate cyclase domain-containing protein [Bradyrhizobium sp. AUGA SZCCT0222]
MARAARQPCSGPRPERRRTRDRHRHSRGRTQFWRVRPVTHRDLTAIGTVVNTASRAQSVAEADQILVTQEVYQRARPDLQDSHSKTFQLKGFDAPIELYAA